VHEQLQPYRRRSPWLRPLPVQAALRRGSSLAVAALVLCLAAGCRDAAEPDARTVAARTPAPAPGQASAPLPRLTISGTRFTRENGAAFQWRGITAFRLVDYVADGDEAAAIRFLDWASRQQLTVVRVLTMMGGLFDLRPEDGRRALPRLLQLAGERGLHVEVVALAGTADIPVDIAQHVGGIVTILESHRNGILEIANEPVHPSQSAEVQNADVLAALASRVPPDLPVSLGSIERGDGFGAGSYITWHAPRDGGRDGWKHVTALAQGADLIGRWKKPVVSDEPIGAGPKAEPGRRDDVPDRFRAAALLTRLTGAGATFHYHAGIDARIPEGRELECFNAWNDAWRLLPADVEHRGTFAAGGRAVQSTAGSTAAVFERVDSSAGWVLVLGDANAVTAIDGWRVARTSAIGGGALLEVAAARAD
jgi:hypothetical protein